MIARPLTTCRSKISARPLNPGLLLDLLPALLALVVEHLDQEGVACLACCSRSLRMPPSCWRSTAGLWAASQNWLCLPRVCLLHEFSSLKGIAGKGKCCAAAGGGEY